MCVRMSGIFQNTLVYFHTFMMEQLVMLQADMYSPLLFGHVLSHVMSHVLSHVMSHVLSHVMSHVLSHVKSHSCKSHS